MDVNVEGGSQKIEAFLALKNVGNINAEYKIIVSVCNNKELNKFSKISETEYKSGGDIAFSTTFVIDYFFEREQILNFKFVDGENSKIDLTFTATLGKIMGSRGNCLVVPITNNSVPLFDFEIDCHNATQSQILIKLDVQATLDQTILAHSKAHLDLTSIYYVLSNINDGKNWRNVYKSEEHDVHKLQYDLVNDLLIDFLCEGDYNRQIKIEFFDVDMKFIGKNEFSLSQLKNSNVVEVHDKDNNRLGTCRIVFTEEKKLKFVDYLKQGLEINLVIGVDMTASNGHPGEKTSYHYINGVEPNMYERAIRACGSIVAYYDYDQLFPCFGYGCRLPNSRTVSHRFALNFEENNPNVQGIDEVIEVYKNCLRTVKLEGPTFFAPLIRDTLSLIETQNTSGKIYYILMILTDGQINDMDETCDVLVKAASYPLSVIIIGIGNADFSNMDTLGKQWFVNIRWR